MSVAEKLHRSKGHINTNRENKQFKPNVLQMAQKSNQGNSPTGESEHVQLKQNVLGQPAFFQPNSSVSSRLGGSSAPQIQSKPKKNDLDIQLSEVDGKVGKNLKDSETLINAYVNKVIAEEKGKIKNLSNYNSRVKLVKNVFHKLGAMSDYLKYMSKIEVWVEEELTKNEYWYLPDDSETKYKGAKDEIEFWGRHKVIGPTMLVAGVKIGSDKLGHFFYDGYKAYFNKMRSEVESNNKSQKDNKSSYEGWDKMKDKDHKGEAGLKGTATNGVYSFADLAANYSGYSFYVDLLFNPDLAFNIRSYMGEHLTASNEAYTEGENGYNSENTRTHWGEETNQNMYREDIGMVVWGNVLRSSPWKRTESESNLMNSPEFKIYPNLDFSTMGLYLTGKQVSTGKDLKIKVLSSNIELVKGIPFENQPPPKKQLYSGIKVQGELKNKTDHQTIEFTIISIREDHLQATMTVKGTNTTEIWNLSKK